MIEGKVKAAAVSTRMLTAGCAYTFERHVR